MNDEHAVRAASASVLGELRTALRQAIAHMRADDVMARRTADEHTSTRLSQIDRRLEDISARLTPHSPSSAGSSHRGYFLGPITAVMVIGFVVVFMMAAAIGGKLAAERAFASGRAAGYAQAAVFERDHPVQWRVYRRSVESLRDR